MSSPPVRLHLLEPGDGAPFAGMTFPAYRHLLEGVPARRHQDAAGAPTIRPLAIGLLVEEEPAGLALAELPMEAGHEPELLSIWVTPSLRGRGLGTLLVAAAEQAVAERGFRRLEAVYTTGKASTPAVERILARRGWAQATLRTVLVRFTVEDLDRIPWMRLPVRPGFEAVPWAEVTPAEKAALRASDAATGWIAPDLRPWDFDARGFEPLTSLALRHHGAIVGWVINHALGPHFLRYTCSFIHPDLGRRGLLITLYAESLRRMRTTPFTAGSLVAPAHHPAMVAFVRRRCAPYVSFTGETRGTFKVLQRPGDPDGGESPSRAGSGRRQEPGDSGADTSPDGPLEEEETP